MHSLHLIVVQAECAAKACLMAENMAGDWGTENNWSCVCGCVSDNDQVYVHDASGRWVPDYDTNTIKKINKMAASWCERDSFDVFKEELSPNKLDEEGVTHLRLPTQKESKSKEKLRKSLDLPKLFVVFLDMHS